MNETDRPERNRSHDHHTTTRNGTTRAHSPSGQLEHVGAQLICNRADRDAPTQASDGSVQRDRGRLVLNSGGNLVQRVNLLLHGATEWLRKRTLQGVDINTTALVTHHENR